MSGFGTETAFVNHLPSVAILQKISETLSTRNVVATEPVRKRSFVKAPAPAAGHLLGYTECPRATSKPTYERFERGKSVMIPKAAAPNVFILSAFDRDQWCPVLQARFLADDLEALRSILGERANDDFALRHQYLLENDELAAVTERFCVAFDPTELQYQPADIFLFRKRPILEAPYLIHTGYELPLLIDGRKKLARLSDVYPPLTFEGENRFDHWVAEGFLHKEEVLDPFGPHIKKWSGHRTVYYTPKGEEWRISASKLILGEFGRTGDWGETHERIEGLLYGYEDWQNDWWIESLTSRGRSFNGFSLCCAVTSVGIAWMELAGFRALPPIRGSTLDIASYDPDTEMEMHDFMLKTPSSVALVRFNVLGRHLLPIFDLHRGGPWEVPGDRIPDLNRHIRGSVIVAARRDNPPAISRST